MVKSGETKKRKVEEREVEAQSSSSSDLDDDGDDDDLDEDEEEEAAEANSEVEQVASKKSKDIDEQLVCDESAYLLYHQAQTGYPCLCLDVISEGSTSQQPQPGGKPFSCYVVAGTQAPEELHDKNRILVLRIGNLHLKEQKDSESEEESEEEDSDDEDRRRPQLHAAAIRHQGDVNRIKFSALSNARPLAAAWSSVGSVSIVDLTEALASVNNMAKPTATISRHSKKRRSNVAQPESEFCSEGNAILFSFRGHGGEGFALDWSPTVPGRLASGDCSGKIHVWQPSTSDAASWRVDAKPFQGHSNSVEEVQWSPVEPEVFASCSADKSVRIWDIRSPSRTAQLIVEDAHSTDVNVLAWNLKEPLMLSGGDDGVVAIWDLRQLTSNSKPQPIATFRHHKGPISSVGWCPSDSSVFAAAGEDDQLTIWDLSVEPDDEVEESGGKGDTNEKDDVPPQLLFVHQGQHEIKELRWHPQFNGVVLSVSLDGIDVFRTISV